MDKQRTTDGARAPAGVNEAAPADRPTVAVIIPTFNQARFLADAITSVLAQTSQAHEIIVVDDGSTDDPTSVVAQFPKVRLIRQENRGLSGARNTGLRSSSSSHIVFLDSDDRLLPGALRAGLSRISDRPDCAFVYGGYRLISEDNNPISPDVLPAIGETSHLATLRNNQVGMIAAVLFRRDCLLAVGGFDETLRRAEDRDLYLRMTQKYPATSHVEVVAEYRKHGQNMSDNHIEQLKVVLQILDRYETRNTIDSRTRATLREGRALKRKYFANEMIEEAVAQWRKRHIGKAATYLIESAQWTPYFTLRGLLAVLVGRASRVLPRSIVRKIERIRGQPYQIPIGSVSFGDLRRLSPISRHHFDRGTPVDRYYIESFLAQSAGDIHGRTLEIADNDYTVRFGGDRVTRSDVLHAVSGNPRATLVGDLTMGEGIPGSAFDCLILTQTLPFIYKIEEAVVQIRNALRPGGVALITVPGISQISRYDMDHWGDYWRFTDASARRLFSEVFGPENVTVVTFGNVLAACAFLHCVAAEELRKEELDYHDVDFQVIIALRVVRSVESQET